MRKRETERQRDGETHDTQDTQEVPPLAACVRTLPEAVHLSLKDGVDEQCLFTFARALKAFEITHDRRLPPSELQSAFTLWWGAATSLLPLGADFDEWRFDFEATFAKTNAALGANSLEEAIRRADANPFPPEANRYTSASLKRLVAVCYHLQLLQGNSPFFLGVRDAAKILGTPDLNHSNAMLAGLVRDGILIEVEKGRRGRATRFRFITQDSTHTAAPAAAPPPNDSPVRKGEAVGTGLERATGQPRRGAGHSPPGTTQSLRRVAIPPAVSVDSRLRTRLAALVAGAETITGPTTIPDERTGSAMPAEREERPNPRPFWDFFLRAPMDSRGVSA